MAKQVMVAFTSPAPGADEDEFNRWYDEVHVKDVFEQGPFTSVRRFRLADQQVAAGPGNGYLAVWEIEEDRLQEAHDFLVSSRAEREEALAAGREPKVPLSPLLAAQGTTWFFEQVSEQVAEPATV
jgi:hypothetical protein